MDMSNQHQHGIHAYIKNPAGTYIFRDQVNNKIVDDNSGA